jgi:hypothetical protein
VGLLADGTSMATVVFTVVLVVMLAFLLRDHLPHGVERRRRQELARRLAVERARRVAALADGAAVRTRTRKDPDPDPEPGSAQREADAATAVVRAAEQRAQRELAETEERLVRARTQLSVTRGEVAELAGERDRLSVTIDAARSDLDRASRAEQEQQRALAAARDEEQRVRQELADATRTLAAQQAERAVAARALREEQSRAVPQPITTTTDGPAGAQPTDAPSLHAYLARSLPEPPLAGIVAPTRPARPVEVLESRAERRPRAAKEQR